MDLLSWNVAGRVKRVSDQIESIAKAPPDIIALQEVLTKTVQALRKGLSAIGLTYCIDSFSLAADPKILTGPRRYGEVIASRWPIQPLNPLDFSVPWPERVLSGLIDTSYGIIEINTTHIPPGVSNGWIKIEMLEGIFAKFASNNSRRRILCGDFNTPQAETVSGNIITWGQTILANGEIKTKRVISRTGLMDTGSRWDLGERNVIAGLAKHGLCDVFRTLNGYGVEAFSHYSHKRFGRRFDHVFCSQSLNPIDCYYVDHLRENGLSDHSAIVARFDPLST